MTCKVRELELQRDAGVVRRAGRVPTVEQWLRTWLDTVAVRSVKTSTFERSYRPKVEHWIIPRLGRHRLDRLQPEHVDVFYLGLAADGLADATVAQIHRILSRALKVAVQRQMIARNVCTLVDPPKAGDFEPMPLAAYEACAVVRAAALGRNTGRWAVAVAVGLRQGEALGLRWPYVDLDRGEIRVDWQLQRRRFRHGCGNPHECGARLHRYPCPADCLKARRTAGRRHVCRRAPCPEGCTVHKPGGCVRFCQPGCTRHERACPQRIGGWIFTRPKGKRRRTVPMPPQLIAILRAERVAEDAERIVAGDAWDDSWDLVWCRPDGRPIDPHADWQEWKDLLRQARVGKDARLHDARHTTGTLLSEQDVTLQVIKEILGHAQISTTLAYIHTVTGPARQAAGRIGDLLWG